MTHEKMAKREMKNARNIAVIGTGYWGKNLVRNYSELGALNTVCDTNARVLEDVAGRYGSVQTTAVYNDLLVNPMIEGIVIALPACTTATPERRSRRGSMCMWKSRPIVIG